MAKITNKDMIYFDMAKKVAYQSDYTQFHLGCVIVYKNVVIGKGYNSKKTHPLQKKYNRKYRDFRGSEQCINDSIHAEMSALTNIAYGFDAWDKVKVYIYRICPGKNNKIGMARPCPACINALKDLGIRHIYYTTDDGYCYEEIKNVEG